MNVQTTMGRSEKITGSAADFVKNNGVSGEIIERDMMESDVTPEEHARARAVLRRDREHLIAA